MQNRSHRHPQNMKPTTRNPEPGTRIPHQASHSPLIPALSVPAALEKTGTGALCLLEETHHQVYGRALTVAETLSGDRVIIAKWVRRLTNWNGRQASRE